jgi:hypothetical protein
VIGQQSGSSIVKMHHVQHLRLACPSGTDSVNTLLGAPRSKVLPGSESPQNATTTDVLWNVSVLGSGLHTCRCFSRAVVVMPWALAQAVAAACCSELAAAAVHAHCQPGHQLLVVHAQCLQCCASSSEYTAHHCCWAAATMPASQPVSSCALTHLSCNRVQHKRVVHSGSW